MNAKLNFLSKHKENRPFCAKALLLAVALWFACAAGALAQGIVEYALIINGVGEEPSIYINLEITGHEKSEEIKDASDLVSACNRQTITEDILYKLKGNIVASQIFTVNKCLKLDLNGHSITSSATKCFNINDNAGLTIVDSSTDEQKGSINCTYNDDSDAIYINSGSKFIADGVTITCAKGSAITNVSGTAKISGCTIKDYSVSGIKNAGGTVTLNDWPTFSAASAAGVSDIWLHQGNTITIGSAITAAPTKEISVRVTDNNDNDLTADALPATITSGYAEKVKSDATTVIDPAEVFTYYKRDAYHIVTLDAATSSEAVIAVDPAKVPVTFAFAEGQEWMTWCSEASFTKPDGVDAYTIDDATAAAITVTPITASDASQPAVLPAYTPLLLRKNGAEGLTAEQYAVPTAPTDDLFKDYGIVSHATTDCTVFGSTKAVTDAASSQVFALGRTYMLKSGEFVAVDQFDGIAANRCWLTLSGTPAASRLLIRSGDATDIRTVAPGPAPSDDHWYSLTGIRLEKRPDRKGIYLNGGKKVIIK